MHACTIRQKNNICNNYVKCCHYYNRVGQGKRKNKKFGESIHVHVTPIISYLFTYVFWSVVFTLFGDFSRPMRVIFKQYTCVLRDINLWDIINYKWSLTACTHPMRVWRKSIIMWTAWWTEAGIKKVVHMRCHLPRESESNSEKTLIVWVVVDLEAISRIFRSLYNEKMLSKNVTYLILSHAVRQNAVKCENISLFQMSVWHAHTYWEKVSVRYAEI